MKPVVAAAQYPVTYHQNFADWQAHTRQWVQEAARNGANLLLFPEYGAMELVSLLPAELHSDLVGQVRALDRFKDAFCSTFAALAQHFGVVIVAPSFPVFEAEKMVNRAFVVDKRGNISYQDKQYMTRFEREEWLVEAGAPVLRVFEAEWGCFGIQICYDVEFPDGAAQLCAAGVQLILAPSCTETIRGSTRVHVGARARALEQQCYTAVSPLIGNADWSPAVDINYGHTAAYSTPDRFFPELGILQEKPANQAGWMYQAFDMELIDAVRKDGQTLNFRDQRAMQLPDFTLERVQLL